VEVQGKTARLLPVAERTRHLFGADTNPAAPAGRRRFKPKTGDLFAELGGSEAPSGGHGDLSSIKPGATVLDRLHQAMILFGADRGEGLKRFLTEESVGGDPRFWKLGQSLSALYPSGSDEKRWLDGVLARKKGLGL